MAGKRIISLLMILSMVAGIISSGVSLSKRMVCSCDVAEMEADQQPKPAALLSFGGNHIALSDAILSNLHTVPAPVALFSLVWAIIPSGISFLRRHSYPTGSSPPFMAAEHRHTYLRISVLLI